MQPLIDDGERFVADQEKRRDTPVRELLEDYRCRRDLTLVLAELTMLADLGLVDTMLAWRERLGKLVFGPQPTLVQATCPVIAFGGLQDCCLPFPNAARRRGVAVDHGRAVSEHGQKSGHQSAPTTIAFCQLKMVELRFGLWCPDDELMALPGYFGVDLRGVFRFLACIAARMCSSPAAHWVTAGTGLRPRSRCRYPQAEGLRSGAATREPDNRWSAAPGWGTCSPSTSTLFEARRYL